MLNGAAIINNGSGIYLGINNLGHLNVDNGTGGVNLVTTNSTAIGLYYAAVQGDATAPGCLCEGFGFGGNGQRGWADIDAGGVNNLTGVSFTSTSTTATSVARLTSLPGLTISQAYHPSASTALIEDTVTITNTSAATISDVRYSRIMDWDIPPTTFNEYVSLQGWPATALLHSGDNGFAVPDVLSGSASLSLIAPADANFTDSGPDDHGAAFIFQFGDLAAGASKTFSIFYGAAPAESSAIAALGTVGAEVYSLGQSNGGQTTGAPATFIFGFAGVGGTPVPPPDVPEPSTYLLFGGGLAALLGMARRRKA